MAILAASFLPSLDTVLYILYVALGLGLVIFFHELGHFAVAKWCNVYVERFSIGFGPILWSRKKGETEYALSAIPFGGYVKMLGQDDMDPSQLSSEEIAEDPRSYSAKSVGQRMAIISAGVIMNVITGVLFYAIAFGVGVQVAPSVVGALQVGMPAWKAGIEQGSTITRIDDRDVVSHGDIARAVALSKDSITVEGVKPDGERFKLTIQPDDEGTRRLLGIAPTAGTQLIGLSDGDGFPPVFPGTAAAKSEPAFEPGDTIQKLDETEISTFWQMQDYLSRHRADPVTFLVKRQESADGETASLVVPPRQFRTLGLWMDIGRITAVQDGSPGAEAGLKSGDRITRINDKAVGKDINPLRVPDLLASLHGQDVKLTFTREVAGGEPTSQDIHLVPLDKPGWVERPIGAGVPLSVPAIGVAYHLIPSVMRVEEGSPAAGQIEEGESIKKLKLVLPEGSPKDGYVDKTMEIKFGEKDESGKLVMNWAYAFWAMQQTPNRTATVTVSKAGESREVELTPAIAAGSDWYLPTRGLVMQGAGTRLQAESLLGALAMGASHTRESIVDIYLTLRNLFTGRLSVKEMRGPVGIATVAFQFAKSGLADLCRFLGFLSVNLAVLNFLPIPVLDGGHMVFLFWEAITRKRPSERVLVAATYVGMAFVLGLMLMVLYLDFFVHWNA